MSGVDPGFQWLEQFAFNDYSQLGEDGILQAILSTLRPNNEWCCELGAADGMFFSNTRRLVEQGWQAVLIEADQDEFSRLQKNNAPFGDRVRCVCAKVNQTCRLETILKAAGAPPDLDLLVIDVDGQDYHLFNSLLQCRPKVVIIEYAISADPWFVPMIGGEGQAGEEAIKRLAAGRYYTLVHQNMHNLIFVRQPDERLVKFANAQVSEAMKP
jgi:hypothetical protein